MRSKSFSKFLRDKSEVRVTTSLIPVKELAIPYLVTYTTHGGKPTGILGVFGADIIVTSVQNILIHKSGTGSHLSEERNLNRLAVLDPLTLLNEDLSGKLATILAVEGGYAVSLGMVAFLKWLKSGHEIVATSHTVRNDTL
jgi:hypothetical protein